MDVSCVDKLSDGLASINKEPPSVVLLDLNLPDSHGAETFRTVLEKAPDVPVVILSGQDDEAEGHHSPPRSTFSMSKPCGFREACKLEERMSEGSARLSRTA